MNYMKILLIYLAGTVTMAVQGTSAPVETPEPTPVAVVTEQAETAVPEETPFAPAATATPEPTQTPPPVPEITPNKKYHNLKRGDKGAEVKKLQERLIELGYLPEGAADGSYGGQTYSAVRRFQANNGLTKDGIAGKRTQTYLFENPDVNPAPTATPGPTDTPAPTDTPEPTGTPAPTDTPEPEEIPTEEPTATPTAKPTEKASEKPTEKPAGKETEAPTGTPAPTDTPAPTPERTAGAPVTSAPATDAPVSKPTMQVEEVDPDELNFAPASGSVAYNEQGEPLSWTEMEDGVQVLRKPRLQQKDGKIRVSLDDLAACLEGWVLTAEGNTVILEAEGHTLALQQEDAGVVTTVDGIERPAATADFGFEEGHFIDAEFLAGMLGGKAEWAEEEKTLILKIPPQQKR